ncbi:MAG: helix-turn-helix transcriptional regulator, partial [Ruminococcus sp.]|nr:helix-turn-helix transcriptional regulator [Ruminococcus sp.]
MIKCCLKSVLRERNLSQKELCQMINASPSTVCDLCNNNAEGIKFSLLERICTALDCD